MGIDFSDHVPLRLGKMPRWLSIEFAESLGLWEVNLPILISGMAGSAALILLTLDSAPNIGLGLAYILLFGIGSIVGMGLLSMIISITICASSKRLTWPHNGLQSGIGTCTLAIGKSIIVRMA